MNTPTPQQRTTPRTDNYVGWGEDYPQQRVVPASFARSLERELAEAKARIAALERAGNELDCTVSAADFDRYYLALLGLTTAIEHRLTITQRDQLEPELSAAKSLFVPVANPERGNASGQG